MEEVLLALPPVAHGTLPPGGGANTGVAFTRQIRICYLVNKRLHDLKNGARKALK